MLRDIFGIYVATEMNSFDYGHRMALRFGETLLVLQTSTTAPSIPGEATSGITVVRRAPTASTTTAIFVARLNQGAESISRKIRTAQIMRLGTCGSTT